MCVYIYIYIYKGNGGTAPRGERRTRWDSPEDSGDRRPSATFLFQGNTFYTRNHKSEVPSEDGTENPWGNSSTNPLEKVTTLWKMYH